eukprot:TRINITY_DN10257_c0_g1_i1.p1 TRINITY_DN10257_c0_g1~~TRINITY_DN10257_c0_g1_i1.p1  ORF type:complete len:341 (+),score=56.87 TRINITY_DN10257_c0_g1_i1:41-1024(+)
MATTEAPTDFYRAQNGEPHRIRRSQILKDHPDVTELYGHDPTLIFKVTPMVLIQLATAYYLCVTDASWWVIVVLAYVWGGTINHSLTLAVHELSHNNGFKKKWANVAFGFFTSLPHAVPTFVTFKKYHLIHHRNQGVEFVDPDLPTALEGKFFRNSFTKFMFLLLQPFVYSFRPMFFYPTTVTGEEMLGYIFQIAFDILVLQYVGVKALSYLFLGLILGSGLHPLAAHFVAEHYLWNTSKDENGNNYETYSYYGPLNYLVFNVGYHNEHHDFPNIAGSKLPLLHEKANEYYKDLPYHESWVYAMYRFVFDPTINPFARVVRAAKKMQ